MTNDKIDVCDTTHADLEMHIYNKEEDTVLIR